ncbi:MAG: ribonuclease P protein component [Candidatus Sumerlaeota bacterium]|nr:ribonuclease P protein component [Candidatus Sumerlaeota bacterium]
MSASANHADSCRRRLAFRRSIRITQRAAYRKIYDVGRKARGRFFICFFAQRPQTAPPEQSESAPRHCGIRLGITVTRKLGNAVTRNRIKRLVKEFVRLRQWELSGDFDVVVNGLPEASAQDTQALWRDLEAIFRRAGLLKAT